MSKHVQITATVTGMSQSLDVIASNVIAGEYNGQELREKLSSVANVLATTASAEKYLMGQVQDVQSFSTVASSSKFDDTLSVVLGTQAQAQLISKMIKGALGIRAEDEEEEEEDVTDEVQEAVSFEEGKEAPKVETPAKVEDDKSEDEMSKEELTAKAMELMVRANAIGQGVNHAEINPEVKQVEKAGANVLIDSRGDTNAPIVKTVAMSASVTAMASQASAQPRVSWNFN